MTSGPWRRARKILWFAAALALLIFVRTGLGLVGYGALRRVLAPGRGRRAPKDVLDRCRWAVARAAPFVPGAVCLAQALAGQQLLAGLGYASSVLVGVAPGERVALRAHAWLKAGETVVIGGDEEDLSGFQVLSVLRPEL